MHLTQTLGFEERFFEVQKLGKAVAYLYFNKKGIVQNLLQGLKYKNHPEIGELLGKWYGIDLKSIDFQRNFDLIVPVPLHESRKKSRGYNQSDFFAKGLSHSLEIPWKSNVLERTKKSQSQTRKNRLQRWKNVEDVFHVASKDLVGKRVLLVDDVITTGATISMCAKALENSGCEEINIAAIALAQ